MKKIEAKGEDEEENLKLAFWGINWIEECSKMGNNKMAATSHSVANHWHAFDVFKTLTLFGKSGSRARLYTREATSSASVDGRFWTGATRIARSSDSSLQSACSAVRTFGTRTVQTRRRSCDSSCSISVSACSAISRKVLSSGAYRRSWPPPWRCRRRRSFWRSSRTTRPSFCSKDYRRTSWTICWTIRCATSVVTCAT